MRGGSNAKPVHNTAPGRKRSPVDFGPTEFDASSLPTPGDLPEGVRGLYREIVTLLEHRGLAEIDLRQVKQYCGAVALAELAQADVFARGLEVETLTGSKPNPSIKVWRDASQQSLRLAEQFGLTLGSRLRLGIHAATSGSVHAAIMEGLEGEL